MTDEKWIDLENSDYADLLHRSMKNAEHPEVLLSWKDLLIIVLAGALVALMWFPFFFSK